MTRDVGWWGQLLEGSEGPERDELLVMNVGRDGLSAIDGTLGLEDVDCLYAICDTCRGRLRVEFDGRFGKALRVTVDDADGHTTQVVPEYGSFLVSFGIYEELGALFKAAGLGEPLKDGCWRETIIEEGRTRPYVYIRTNECDQLVFTPPKEGGLERFCLRILDLLAGGRRGGGHRLCVGHFPKRYARRTDMGYSEETFEIAYNGPVPKERLSLSWKDYDLSICASGFAGGHLVNLQVVYRDTGFEYYELEPVLMRSEERFWFPITLSDGYEEYWDLIVSAHAIDPLDWIEGFERVGKDRYRCTEIDRMNDELFESYPFRG